MPVISEKAWRTALTEILDDLDPQQYTKMLFSLSEIPKRVKTKSIEEMPQTIIEHYGVATSVHKINEIMDLIPRRDAAVQDRLRPFVDKLKNKTGKKRKRSEAVLKPVGRKDEAGEQKNHQPDETEPAGPEKPKKKRAQSRTPSLNSTRANKTPETKSIRDLKITGNHGNKAIAGKVVQKSGLRTYRTRNEEEKSFFYLGVADDTSSIKVMVYGTERYQFFSEGRCYLFRDVIMEGEVMKVTKKSNILMAPPLDVPENLEMEARMLVDFQIPVRSIAQANIAEEKTSVSVEGTITEIGPIENIKLKTKRGKKDKQEFRLEDGTGSIRITLWGEDTKHLRGISHGDVARVTNVKTSHFRDSVSLNSTDSTRIVKVQSAAGPKCCSPERHH